MKINVGKLRAIIREELTREASKKQRSASPTIDTKKALALLSFTFTYRVDESDIPYIEFRPSKNKIILQDIEDDEGVMRLGNMYAPTSAKDIARYLGPNVTPYDFGEWLAKHGARKIRPKKRVRYHSIYD